MNDQPQRTIVYGDMVRSLAKSGKDILETLTANKCEMWHHASCIMGEGGEGFDAIKKHVIYNAPFGDAEKEALREELGDLEFYLEGLRQAAGLTRQECLDHNATKLAKRYGDKFQYSDQAARDRADKQPGAAPERTYKTLSDHT